LPIVPGYELLGELGRGGMGIVFKARQNELNRLVALKMILGRTQVDAEPLLRFRREAEAVAQLQHPHIVQIYEIGTLEGQPYFALEYVAGGSLDRYLRGQPQSPLDAAALVQQLAQAVQAAHERGIIHRDLKPANVLLALRYAPEARTASEMPASNTQLHEYTPKITDFGLAKRLTEEQGQTKTGEIVGTPSYMSPEQAGGQSKLLGPGVDVYALGAILYELVTGRPPFKGLTPMETVLQVLHEEPVPPSRLVTKLPVDLETICLKCLAKEPQQRYPTAAALAEDLRCFLGNEPIRARRSGWVERGRKWAKRRPAVAGLLLGIVVVTLVSVLGITSALLYALAGWEEASRKEQEAVLAGDVARKAQVHEARLRQRADEEAETAKQVAQFLSGLFEDTDPLAMTGRTFGILHRPEHELTAREVLDRGVKKLNTHLQAQPHIRAALLDKIGNVYLGLGEVDKAAPLLEEAYALRSRRYGPGHPEVAASLQSLGWLHLLQGKKDAEALCRRALALREKLYGPEHPLIAESLFYLSAPLLLEERFPEAVPLLQRAWELRCKFSGRVSREAGAVLLFLAYALVRNQDTKQALPYLLEVADLCERLEGQKDVGTLIRREIRAHLAKAAGNLTLARDLSRENIDLSARLLGKEHFVTLVLQYAITDILLEMGDYAEAEKVYRQILPKAHQVLGPQHIKVVDAQLQLARCCYRLRHLEEAYKVAGEAAVALRPQPEWDRQRLLANCLRVQGWVRRDQQRWKEAEAIVREELGLRLKLRGPTHDTVEQSWNALAFLLHQQGKRDEARQASLEELACAQRLYQLPPIQPFLEKIANGKFGEELKGASVVPPAILEMVPILEQWLARCPHNLVLCHSLPKLYASLGIACAAGGDPHGARHWQRKYLAVTARLPGPPVTAADRYERACLRALGSRIFPPTAPFTAEEQNWSLQEGVMALRLLQGAIRAGFRDRGLLEQESAWTTFWQQPEFQQLLQTLKTE
jgi:tetratricopeptide (TPR) repeat protein